MKSVKILMVVVIAVVGLNGKVNAQPPYWEWARQAISISANGFQEGWSITTDKFENVYITGFYYDTVTFGNYTFSCPNGSSYIYLVKYDSAGNIVWAWSSRGNGIGTAVGVATDSFGNVFLTAEGDSLVFDNDTLNSNGSYND